VATILIIFLSQLAKFSACSINNKGKQGWQNKFKSKGTNNLLALLAETILNCCMQNCHINFRNFQHFGGVEPASPLPF